MMSIDNYVGVDTDAKLCRLIIASDTNVVAPLCICVDVDADNEWCLSTSVSPLHRHRDRCREGRSARGGAGTNRNSRGSDRCFNDLSFELRLGSIQRISGQGWDSPNGLAPPLVSSSSTSMASTSIPRARPYASGPAAFSPSLLVARRVAAPVRAFRRIDLDRFARRVASGEALRDAWRSANTGIEQLAFEARRAAERLDRRYSLSRRFDSASRAAAARARELDQELGIGRRWRSFSMDFSRNWPRV
ncbi:hypothetical protein BHE74_00034269 [Ensete ventricosum]|nr:hypothetical protein BHE74_00034269 [Ensete ventricosum]